jgi:hypothetical protein
MVTLRSVARRMSASASCAFSSVIGLADQRGEGEEPHQRPFQHAHVGRDPVGEEFEHLRRRS